MTIAYWYTKAPNTVVTCGTLFVVIFAIATGTNLATYTQIIIIYAIGVHAILATENPKILGLSIFSGMNQTCKQQV